MQDNTLNKNIHYGFHWEKKEIFEMKAPFFQLINVSFKINTFQLFLCSPQSHFKNSYNPSDYNKTVSNIIKGRQDLNLFVHSQYIINLANPDLNNIQISQLCRQLKQMTIYNHVFYQMKRKEKMDKKYKLFRGLVVHTGKNEDQQKGIQNLKYVLQTVLNEVNACFQKYPLQNIDERYLKEIYDSTQGKFSYQKNNFIPDLILETSAGQKNEILSDLQSFHQFIQEINHESLSICVDTCHIYQAGQLDYFLKNMNKFIQNDKQIMFHLNDSKVQYVKDKTGVDRHQIIGQGNNKVI